MTFDQFLEAHSDDIVRWQKRFAGGVQEALDDLTEQASAEGDEGWRPIAFFLGAVAAHSAALGALAAAMRSRGLTDDMVAKFGQHFFRLNDKEQTLMQAGIEKAGVA